MWYGIQNQTRARRGGYQADARVDARTRAMSGGDPHHRVAHRANRQFNRQNPAFANRPTPGHFDHTSKWPVPQRWSAAGRENVMPKLPYAEDANGNDRSLPLMPRHDASLTPEVLLAALNDDADRLRDLLSRGAGTECRTETGATPLICAAAKGADAAVEVLLECDANVVATDKLGANCLTLAAYHGRVETARAILASRRVRETDGALEALLKWPTVGGETPLMAAAKNGHAAFVTMLLETMRGNTHPLPPYDDGGDPRRVTAMQLACRRGALDAVKALVAGGAPIGERSGPRQMSPLMHAACQGQNEVCAFLLNPSKALGQTFRQANEGAHEAADPTAKDADALTALLHAACATGVGPPSVDRDEPARRCFITLAHAWPGGPEAAYQARDRKGRNALMLSARFGNAAIFKMLLSELGAASLREFDGHRESALFAAIKGGFVEPGGLAETALRVYPVHEDELEMLEVKNLDGLTPLLWCAAHGRTEAARWCVANGADILAVDAKGRLPRQVADARGHAETAEALSALARDKWLKL